MATVKYQGKSPYEEERHCHDPTDEKFESYLQSLKPLGSSAHTKSTVYDIALFGLGRAGSIHLGNLLRNSRCRVKYIVDASEERAKDARIYFRLSDEVKLLSPKDESIVLNDKSIAGIIVASPTEYHEELVIKALNAGKAVLCEKPVSKNPDGIERCYDAALKNKCPLLCALNRRFDSAVEDLKNKVHAGAVGQVHRCKTVSRDSPLPSIQFLSQSGGITHDCAVHDIDLICWILGEYPEKVSAIGSTFIPEIKKLNDFDTVCLTMKFPSGTISSTDLSRNAVYGYDQRIEVFGPKGMLTLNNTKPNNIVYSGSMGDSQCPIFHSFPSKFFDAYQKELDHFIDLIEGTVKTARVSKESILKVATICNAVEQSLKQEKIIKVNY